MGSSPFQVLTHVLGTGPAQGSGWIRMKLENWEALVDALEAAEAYVDDGRSQGVVTFLEMRKEIQRVLGEWDKANGGR